MALICEDADIDRERASQLQRNGGTTPFGNVSGRAPFVGVPVAPPRQTETVVRSAPTMFKAGEARPSDSAFERATTGQERIDPRNIGHGHVLPRPDGVKARCGGPNLCSVCAQELAEAVASGKIHLPVQPDKPHPISLIMSKYEGHPRTAILPTMAHLRFVLDNVPTTAAQREVLEAAWNRLNTL